MFNNMFFYLFICLLFFGIGDFLSVLTKAKVSSVFVSLLLFLIAFITGIIPPDIIKQAGLADFGKWAILFIVFSLGTTINLRELIDEWRAQENELPLFRCSKCSRKCRRQESCCQVFSGDFAACGAKPWDWIGRKRQTRKMRRT